MFHHKLFGENNMPSFYSGKCYIISNRFTKYISKHGQTVAEEHKKYFPGAEDVMIGCLCDRYQE